MDSISCRDALLTLISDADAVTACETQTPDASPTMSAVLVENVGLRAANVTEFAHKRTLSPPLWYPTQTSSLASGMGLCAAEKYRQESVNSACDSRRMPSPAEFHWDGQERLACRFAFDGGHAVFHPFPATDKCIERRDHHRNRIICHRRARLELASGSTAPADHAGKYCGALRHRNHRRRRASVPTFSDWRWPVS
jgi:hypothetical protein